jgi:hypothetical protein
MVSLVPFVDRGDLDLLEGEESVVGGIRYAFFAADMRSITARCGCFATHGVDAVNRCDPREHTPLAVADYSNQQPRNGINIG